MNNWFQVLLGGGQAPSKGRWFSIRKTSIKMIVLYLREERRIGQQDACLLRYSRTPGRTWEEFTVNTKKSGWIHLFLKTLNLDDIPLLLPILIPVAGVGETYLILKLPHKAERFKVRMKLVQFRQRDLG